MIQLFTYKLPSLWHLYHLCIKIICLRKNNRTFANFFGERWVTNIAPILWTIGEKLLKRLYWWKRFLAAASSHGSLRRPDYSNTIYYICPLLVANRALAPIYVKLTLPPFGIESRFIIRVDLLPLINFIRSRIYCDNDKNVLIRKNCTYGNE